MLNNTMNATKKKREPKTTKPHPKMKFTPEEDEKLKRIVKKYGDNDWELVCEHMDGRNQRQCKERYLNYLSPDVNNNPWNSMEDNLLLKKHNELGPKWVRISRYFKGRSDTSIKNRFMVLMRRLNCNDTLNLTSVSSPSPINNNKFTPNAKPVTIPWEVVKQQLINLNASSSDNNDQNKPSTKYLNQLDSDGNQNIDHQRPSDLLPEHLFSSQHFFKKTQNENKLDATDEIDYWDEALSQCGDFENLAW